MENNVIVLAFQEEPFNIEERFEQETKAEIFLETVYEWQEAGLVDIADAVIAIRGVGGDVKIKQTQSLAGKYALGGAGIGFLAGMLIGGPIGGLVTGTAIGAISGKMKDIGIDDKFIKDASEGMAPNSSALFLMGKSNDRDALIEALKSYEALVATTTLDEETEKALKRALSGGE